MDFFHFLYGSLLQKSKNYYLNTIITPSVIFTQGFATSGLLTKMHESLILVPALQSHWLMMHVSMMILGYATLLCGSLLSVAILVITFQELIQIIGKSKNFYFLNESFSFAEIKYMNMTDKNNVLQKLFCLIEIIIDLNFFNNWIVGVTVLLV